MPSPWDAHKLPTFGQDHVGEQVSNMEIESKANGDKGLSMKLKCPKDKTEFWVQLWEGGQNAVLRGDHIHAQCPGCGVEWNGEPAHFYAIAVTKKLGIMEGGATELGIVDTVAAKSPYDALTKVISEGLIPEVLRNGHENYRGLTITEVTENEYKVLRIKKRAREAVEAGDPNLKSILDECMKEELEIVGKSPDPMAAMMSGQGSGPLDKLMQALKIMKEFKDEQEGRSGFTR